MLPIGRERKTATSIVQLALAPPGVTAPSDWWMAGQLAEIEVWRKSKGSHPRIVCRPLVPQREEDTTGRLHDVNPGMVIKRMNNSVVEETGIMPPILMSTLEVVT